MVLLGVLYGHHVAHRLHHADRRAVAADIAAHGADLRIADVVAHTAIARLGLQLFQCGGKRGDLFFRHPQEEQGVAQRRLAPHSGQFGQLAHGPLQGLRWILTVQVLFPYFFFGNYPLAKIVQLRRRTKDLARFSPKSPATFCKKCCRFLPKVPQETVSLPATCSTKPPLDLCSSKAQTSRKAVRR